MDGLITTFRGVILIKDEELAQPKWDSFVQFVDFQIWRKLPGLHLGEDPLKFARHVESSSDMTTKPAAM